MAWATKGEAGAAVLDPSAQCTLWCCWNAAAAVCAAQARRRTVKGDMFHLDARTDVELFSKIQNKTVFGQSNRMLTRCLLLSVALASASASPHATRLVAGLPLRNVEGLTSMFWKVCGSPPKLCARASLLESV